MISARRPTAASQTFADRHRRRFRIRPSVEDMESRIVLSATSGLVAPVATPMVQAQATPKLVLSPMIEGVTITSLVPNGQGGRVSFVGTADGTVLGKAFTSPVTGTITPGRGSHGAPTLSMNLESVGLTNSSLDVGASPISLNVSVRRSGTLATLFESGLNNVLQLARAGSTTSAISALNAGLNNPQLASTLNADLASSRVSLGGIGAVRGVPSPIVSLLASPIDVKAGGLEVKVNNGHGRAVVVNVFTYSSNGPFFAALTGITGKGSKAARTAQVATALNTIAATQLPIPILTTNTPSTTTTTPTPGGTSSGSTLADPVLVSLDLKPLDVNLLGLEVKTSEITVTVSAQPGSGALLGNLLSTVSNLINLQGVSTALNNVLGNVVTLANASTLTVSGVGSTGPLSTATVATTPVLTAHIAPVNLNLLGAVVTTSPIDLSIVAHSGPGLVLGNAVTDLANLLNTPPKNGKLDLNYINTQLQTLINQLNAQIPGIAAAPSPTIPLPAAGTTNILHLAVAPINLNLLGLTLQTDQINVNADANSGSGQLLGNLLVDLFNTLNATPTQLNTLNNEVNGLLAKVIGVLNATNLVLPAGALNALSPTLQQLALPNLVNPTGTASVPVLNLSIASTVPNAPPVDVNLLGLVVTTSDIHARLNATTGDGQILGNLVYNVSHLLDPGGSLNLLTILNTLGL